MPLALPTAPAQDDAVEALDRLLADCGADPSFTCREVLERTDNAVLARFAEWFVEIPLTILLVLLGAWALNRLARRAIDRGTQRLRAAASELRTRGPERLRPAAEAAARAEARAETLRQVLRNLAAVSIYALAALVALGEVGISLGPLIAGAGVAGVALGFGAQSVVRDYLAGLFLLVEDQFGVGDIVTLAVSSGEPGPIGGTVEQISLRSTRLRDINGTVWHVPNGELRATGNLSKHWARAVVDVPVAYEADLPAALAAIEAVAARFGDDDDWRADTNGPPRLLGVEQFTPENLVVRVMVDTEPARQWDVARELRSRLKSALDAAGVAQRHFPRA